MTEKKINFKEIDGSNTEVFVYPEEGRIVLKGKLKLYTKEDIDVIIQKTRDECEKEHRKEIHSMEDELHDVYQINQEYAEKRNKFDSEYFDNGYHFGERKERNRIREDFNKMRMFPMKCLNIKNKTEAWGLIVDEFIRVLDDRKSRGDEK